VLPLALPAVVLAGVGGVLAWFAGAHIWITLVAIVAVAAAWLWVWRQSRRARARAARRTIYMLATSTMLLGVALIWPVIEPSLMKVLR
jgi:uncharacterized membrane protein YfcA